MNPTFLTDDERALWQKIEAFQLDEPGVVVNFTARLAKENGWSVARARRAMEEYRRFLFLTMRAGHPVSPPEAVDQAWHLHLLYTRSYWRDLCHGVLGRPLHHEPTEGGFAESGKFRDWYAATLASYARYFGEPPSDVWPPVENHNQPKREQWVDVSRHWLLPKPRFVRRLRPAMLIAAGLVIAVAMLVPGCMDRQFVFDLTGPEFLGFYITAFFAALALSVIIGAIVRRRNSRAVDDPTDAYDIAMLGGGGTRVVDAALSALYAKELLSVRRDNNKGTFVKARPMRHKADLPEAEEVVYSALPKSEEVPLRDLRRAVAPAMEQMQQRLADQGLTLTVDALSGLRTWVASPFALLLVIGFNKISIGLSRKKPVSYLVILCVITLLVMMIRVARINRRTTGGEEAWQRLHGGFLPSIASEGAAAAPLAVALLGLGALSTAPGFSELHAALQRPRNLTGSSGGCGSGCGSSCGGGGCGGGGCGGGGCGGCGGGGGD